MSNSNKNNCCVYNCPSFRGTNVRMHKFPTNKLLKMEWKKVLQIEEISKSMFVCGKHFNKDDYMPNESQLNVGAVPSLNLPKKNSQGKKANSNLQKIGIKRSMRKEINTTREMNDESAEPSVISNPEETATQVIFSNSDELNASSSNSLSKATLLNSDNNSNELPIITSVSTMAEGYNKPVPLIEMPKGVSMWYIMQQGNPIPIEKENEKPESQKDPLQECVETDYETDENDDYYFKSEIIDNDIEYISDYVTHLQSNFKPLKDENKLCSRFLRTDLPVITRDYACDLLKKPLYP